MFCRKEMTAYVPTKYDYKEVKVKCGNTSPSGYPYQCDECAEKNQHVNWDEEAAANGERIEPLD